MTPNRIRGLDFAPACTVRDAEPSLDNPDDWPTCQRRVTWYARSGDSDGFVCSRHKRWLVREVPIDLITPTSRSRIVRGLRRLWHRITTHHNKEN